MKVEQVYTIVNDIAKELIGDTAVVQEDLSNVVDVGNAIFGAASVDNYVKKLVDHIGKVIFVNRPYSGSVPSVMMDGWEYGAVLEKISADLPESRENESWNLTDGKSYDQDVFYQPKVEAKFFSQKVTFEVDLSFTERQVKGSFSSASQLNGFLSMLYNAVEKAMTLRVDGLVMRTINNMTALTLGDTTGNRAVNLLKLYNTKFGGGLTAEKAITTPEFIRFASMTMSLYIDRMSKMSTLFNGGGKERFTPSDALHVVMLSDFKAAAGAYLQSDTFNEQYVALPNAETVPYWQGSGTDYSFDSVSSINVKANDGTTDGGKAVEQSGILAVMFDRDALGVCNIDRRVTTNYNARAEFFTNYYKFDAGYFNDVNENFVVFYVAD